MLKYIWLRLVVIIIVAAACGTLHKSAWAQQPSATTDDGQLNSTLQSLIKRYEKSDDPEVIINTIQSALQIESKIRRWTHKEPRDIMRGTLLFNLGTSYWNRERGNYADNLENAISSYEASIKAISSVPDYAAQVNNHLGMVLFYRIRGE